MAWYYAESGQQKGPVDDAALDELVRQGAVRDDTLIWQEGMATWQPHGAVRGSRGAAVAAAPPPPPGAGPETRYCSECGRPFAAHELSMVGNAAVCGTCRPIVMQRGQAAGAQTAWNPSPGNVTPGYPPPGYQTPGYQAQGYPPAGGRRYAGFWIRFVARIIDGIIVGVVSSIIRIPLALAFGLGGAGLRIANDPGAAIAALPMLMSFAGLSFFIQIALGVAYETYFVSTRGATPGKMALGLKIIRASDGGLLTPVQVVGRYFAMWLSAIICFIGYIIAGFDPEKRSLHDRICETRVIYAR